MFTQFRQVVDTRKQPAQDGEKEEGEGRIHEQDIAKGAIDYHNGPPAKSRGYSERRDWGSLQIDHYHASRSAPIIGYAHY
jgi:hypothetical protein